MIRTFGSILMMSSLLFILGCAASQPAVRSRSTQPATLTVWSKGTTAIPGMPEQQWIAISGGTFGQFKSEKGNVCCHLRVDAKGTTEWAVDNSSILELTQGQGGTVSIKPLKEGQYVITVRVDGTSTKLSGKVFDEDWAFVVTMSGD